jgi:hypothetical protein
MRIKVRTAGSLVGAVVLVTVLSAGPAAASLRGGQLVKTGPVSLSSGPSGCPAASLHATVRVSRLVLRPGQSLMVSATVHNVGSRPCPYNGMAPTSTQGMGPCGVLSIEVLNSRHRDVWPGALLFSCPAQFFEEIQPGASITAAGDWNPSSDAGGRAPPGRYRVIVGGHLSFGITLS